METQKGKTMDSTGLVESTQTLEWMYNTLYTQAQEASFPEREGRDDCSWGAEE